jgi:anti-sigma B factor antagonist
MVTTRVEKTNNEAVTCYIEGEMNIDSCPAVRKALTKLMAKKISKITLDFSGIIYIDSSGLGMLIEILKEIQAYGGKLELSRLPERIKNIFEIKKLDKLFTIV